MAALPPDRPAPPPLTREQKKRNLRLGLVLGAIAVAIFVGFIAKSIWIGM